MRTVQAVLIVIGQSPVGSCNEHAILVGFIASAFVFQFLGFWQQQTGSSIGGAVDVALATLHIEDGGGWFFALQLTPDTGFEAIPTAVGKRQRIVLELLYLAEIDSLADDFEFCSPLIRKAVKRIQTKLMAKGQGLFRCIDTGPNRPSTNSRLVHIINQKLQKEAGFSGKLEFQLSGDG